jgi:hypothetical protein
MCLADTPTATDAGLAYCSYGSWQPRYAAVTAASRAIDLDQAVVDFLQEDGLVLPEESHAVSAADPSPEHAREWAVLWKGFRVLQGAAF